MPDRLITMNKKSDWRTDLFTYWWKG